MCVSVRVAGMKRAELQVGGEESSSRKEEEEWDLYSSLRTCLHGRIYVYIKAAQCSLYCTSTPYIADKIINHRTDERLKALFSFLCHT